KARIQRIIGKRVLIPKDAGEGVDRPRGDCRRSSEIVDHFEIATADDLLMMNARKCQSSELEASSQRGLIVSALIQSEKGVKTVTEAITRRGYNGSLASAYTFREG
ncbi:hypothetical protein, partial [Salmonella enterica]|uniref:hypothetical protein n=1 Tax=Salmonella enterica TaxID=28901 RepID=UPI00352415D0